MKSNPIRVHVVGRSGSGKTTAIVYLTEHLTKLGFRVGVVKHVHHEGFTFDTKGKNTWRHAEAGASIVIGVSPNELATFKRTDGETPFNTLFDTFERENLDLVLVEGFSRAPSTKHSYKIVAAKNVRELRQVLRQNRPPIIAITGPVGSSKINEELLKKRVPFIDVMKNGSTLTAIVRKLAYPRELQETFRRASVRHGGSCVGLAVGIRAAYLASNVLGPLGSSDKVIVGAKNCMAEAFRTVYPEARTRLKSKKDDRIIIESLGSKLLIKLAPKKKYRNGGQALLAPEKELFESVVHTKL